MILEINSDPSELKKVREKVEVFCKENQIKVNLLEIKLAIDEALQNIIRHAYKLDKTKKITIKLEKISGDSFKAEIRDFGERVPIDQIKHRALDDIKPGGLGVHFIKSISKEMTYEHKDEAGTLLTLVF
ncbi:ATP-binding protein [Candidatus Pelagibacter sp.]|jgi:serine/threonine-protein kinase RsbW|nr:ATP-binding protein [Candidatus Pelagibacter sp.]